MSIRKRISSAIGVLMVLFLTITGIGVLGLHRQGLLSDDLYSVRMATMSHTLRAELEAHRSNMFLLSLLWENQQGTLLMTRASLLRKEALENRDSVVQRMAAIRDLMSSDAEEVQIQLGILRDQIDQWAILTEEIVSLAKNREFHRASELYDASYRTLFDLMRINLGFLNTRSRELAEENHTVTSENQESLFTLFAVFALIGTVSCLVTILGVSSKVIRPILTISSQVASMADGTGDLTIRLNLGGKDEMSELASHINLFIEKTEGIMRNLRSSVMDAKNVDSGIVASISHNSKSIVSISDNLQSISDQFQRLNQAISDARSVQERVENSVDVFRLRVDDQAGMVEESTASVTEMIASIANLSRISTDRKDDAAVLQEKADIGEKQVKESEETVQAIYADLESILETTSIIAGIASQTNLLAMNAAIEAAHAGENGRGFAVVADEIRKLAESSSHQSRSINETLKTTISKIEKANEASRFTTSTYHDILQEFQQLIAAFDEIAANSSELNLGGTQVLEAMHVLMSHSQSLRGESTDLSDSSRRLQIGIEEMVRVSSYVGDSVDEINSSAKNIADSMVGMKDLANLLDRSMEQAETSVALFRVSTTERSPG